MQVTAPPAVDTVVYAAGGTVPVAFSVETGQVALAPGDVNAVGALVTLNPGDTMWLAANTPEAAAEWHALSSIGATVVVHAFTG